MNEKWERHSRKHCIAESWAAIKRTPESTLGSIQRLLREHAGAHPHLLDMQTQFLLTANSTKQICLFKTKSRLPVLLGPGQQYQGKLLKMMWHHPTNPLRHTRNHPPGLQRDLKKIEQVWIVRRTQHDPNCNVGYDVFLISSRMYFIDSENILKELKWSWSLKHCPKQKAALIWPHQTNRDLSHLTQKLAWGSYTYPPLLSLFFLLVLFLLGAYLLWFCLAPTLGMLDTLRLCCSHLAEQCERLQEENLNSDFDFRISLYCLRVFL